MEAQMHRQHGHHGYEEEPRSAGLHSAVEGEGEGEHHHGEKKSVLKKVKDKAKKIKDTIKKHGHGHEHEHGDYTPEEEEEEDEDEEMVDDPEIHGAPVYESSAMRTANLGQGITPGQTGVNMEKHTDTREDTFGANVRHEGVPRPSVPLGSQDVGITGPSVPGGMVGDMGRTRAGENVTRPSAASGTNDDRVMETRPSVPGGITEEAITRPSVASGIHDELGRGAARESETSQTAFGKVADSSVLGRGEANVLRSDVKIGLPVGLEEDPHSPKNFGGEIPPSNYQSKVADPTGTGGKEADVAPLVWQFDKMNVQDEANPKSRPEPEQRSYTGSHDQFAPQPTPTADQFRPESSTIKGPEDSGATPKSFDATGKPEDMPRDTVTEKISYATSAIADKAISAKNVVASKLGYAGGDEEVQDSTKQTSESGKPVSETASEYAHSVAATVTEKLAPVYQKVADASSTVMSKVQGSGAPDEGRDRAAEMGTKGVSEGTDKGVSVEGIDRAADMGTEGVSKGTDKGVSVKGYWTEKFKPRDEDKALSQAISGALHKKKGETVRTGGEKTLGKVTESENVVRRLGTGKENKREGEDALSAGSESRGTGVMDRLKDAVGSWLGKSAGTQTAQESLAQSHVSDMGSGPTRGNEQGGEVVEKRRLQESSN